MPVDYHVWDVMLESYQRYMYTPKLTNIAKILFFVDDME